MKKESIAFLRRCSYPIVLIVIIASMTAIVELRHPYFFLQDDNRDYFLPIYVENLRAVMHGEVPQFNFHQFCGTPLLSATQSAPFYPLNYGALVVSKVLLGHYLGAIDIIAFCHLIIAGLGFFFFTRVFGLHERSCFFGALGWVFCGFVFSVGDSWIPVVGFAAYLPWISLLTLRMYQNVNARNFVLLVLVRSVLFFLGWPQYFIFSVTFEIANIILLLVFTRQPFALKYSGMPGNSALDNPSHITRFLKYYIFQYVCVIFIVLPVLIPGLHHMTISNRSYGVTWEEYSSMSYDIKNWIYGLIYPFTEVSGEAAWTNQNFISHIGYVTNVFLLIGAFSVRNRRYNFIVVYILLGLLTFLFASNNFISRIFYFLPFYNKFRWPFKAAFFTSYSLVIVATFGFDIFHERLQGMKPKAKQLSFSIFVCLVALLLINIGVLYLSPSQKMFGVHLDKVPFDEPLKDLLRSGRIVSLDPNRLNSQKSPGFLGHTSPYLGYNYATLWELYHFGGYEALLLRRNAKATLNLNHESYLTIDDHMPLENQRKLLSYLRTWGVQWYVVDKNNHHPFFGNLVLKYSDDYRNVFYDSLARPIVSWETDSFPHDEVGYKFNAGSIEVNAFANVDKLLNINVLFNKYFSAYIDGNAKHLIETQDSQMELFVPKGSHVIRIEYADPYFQYGAMGTGVFFVVALSLAVPWRKSLFRPR